MDSGRQTNRFYPKDKDAYYSMSIAYINIGQWDMGITDLSKVLEPEPNNQLPFAAKEYLNFMKGA